MLRPFFFPFVATRSASSNQCYPCARQDCSETAMRATSFLTCILLSILALPVVLAYPAFAQTAPSTKTKIILDTDIGDDIDDAFALALALRSPRSDEHTS